MEGIFGDNTCLSTKTVTKFTPPGNRVNLLFKSKD